MMPSERGTPPDMSKTRSRPGHAFKNLATADAAAPVIMVTQKVPLASMSASEANNEKAMVYSATDKNRGGTEFGLMGANEMQAGGPQAGRRSNLDSVQSFGVVESRASCERMKGSDPSRYTATRVMTSKARLLECRT